MEKYCTGTEHFEHLGANAPWCVQSMNNMRKKL